MINHYKTYIFCCHFKIKDRPLYLKLTKFTAKLKKLGWFEVIYIYIYIPLYQPCCCHSKLSLTHTHTDTRHTVGYCRKSTSHMSPRSIAKQQVTVLNSSLRNVVKRQLYIASCTYCKACKGLRQWHNHQDGC